MNHASGGLNAFTIFLFALGVFFLTGVYVLAKQGIRTLTVIVFILAALAIAGGVLRL